MSNVRIHAVHEQVKFEPNKEHRSRKNCRRECSVALARKKRFQSCAQQPNLHGTRDCGKATIFGRPISVGLHVMKFLCRPLLVLRRETQERFWAAVSAEDPEGPTRPLLRKILYGTDIRADYSAAEQASAAGGAR